MVIDCCRAAQRAVAQRDLRLRPDAGAGVLRLPARSQGARGRARAQRAGAGARSGACRGATCSRATTPGAG
ncbi:MAG: hypothetical protein MZW92_50650 [Comamonadaceae bacterium]|nr:hypothetical protein [Comamonadaceae bacterium]